jgi:tRNA pseudouridine38-40 synthase
MRLTFGYDGTDYCGSQLQPGQRTVQGELERAIATVGAGEVRLALAGRTDRGVHAIGQVASGEVRWRRSSDQLREALNAVLPYDLVVASIEVEEAGIQARYSARWREYRYRIVEAPTPPALDRRYAWWRRATLDACAAGDVAARFVGRHCFGSFAAFGKSRRMTAAELERTVLISEWRTREYDLGGGLADARLHEYRIVADGYLPQMVRALVGAVVDVAQGRRTTDWIDAALNVSDRSAIGESAPPHGLTLWRVGYNNDTPGAWSGAQDE